jgi:apolipoprotein D and lipocalin family protein
MKTRDKALIAGAAAAGIAGLAYAFWPKKKVPKTAIVNNFDKTKYLGLWHEIARLPNGIEKHLKDLTETYELNADGSIKVITRAYHTAKNKIVEAEGTAKFIGADTTGALKVAYFVPVYLDYYILDLDENYRYALVSGSGLDYLWILSREENIPDEIGKRFLDKATALGFDVTKLEWMNRF